MREILSSAPRPRRITIVSWLMVFQALTFWLLGVFVFVVVMSVALRAGGHHKPTAAALITAFAAVGGGSFLLIGLLLLLLAWGLWRQKGWAFWCSTILEGLLFLIALVALFGGITWVTLSEGILGATILVFLIAGHLVRTVSRK